ncbi:hypothetical protein D3C78_863030 [compost metagenome]
MRNGRIAFGEITGQHHIRHQLQEGVQIIHVETHRSGKGHGIAAGAGALQVENALADFLLAETVEGGRRHILAATQYMGVAAGQKNGVAACQRQPLAGGFAQFRLADTDEMEPCRFLLGKSCRPGGGHAASAVFHAVEPQATQHFRQGIIHGALANLDVWLRNTDFLAWKRRAVTHSLRPLICRI